MVLTAVQEYASELSCKDEQVQKLKFFVDNLGFQVQLFTGLSRSPESTRGVPAD